MESAVHVGNIRVPKRRLTISCERPTSAPKKSRRSSISVQTTKPAYAGFPLAHPMNRNGLRYILAELDPVAQFCDVKPIEEKFVSGAKYRMVIPDAVLIAPQDREVGLKISGDRLLLTGFKGYGSARCTHYVSRGSWYWEATIENMPPGSATRIGWAQQYAELQAPVGVDKFGFSWRSRKGTKFHGAHGKHYSDGYGTGDVLGFLIVLPEGTAKHFVPKSVKNERLVAVNGRTYYEAKNQIGDMEIHQDSKIYFFKNGECQGLAFENIYAGAYYPAISIFKGATVRLNFGADKLKYPEVLKEFNCQPMKCRVKGFRSELRIADWNFFNEQDEMNKMGMNA